MAENKKTNPPPSKESLQAKQMELFGGFLCNTAEERDALSNTIEFWDAIPKYFVSRKRQTDLRKPDGGLETIKQEFLHRRGGFMVSLRPARIDVNGKEVEFFPSAREELVEDALRKIACDRGRGYYENGNRSGVVFSLHMLRKELKKRGHTLSCSEVKESLQILRRSNIELDDGNMKYDYSILTELVTVTKGHIEEDPKARWYADFSILLSEGIKKMAYRQYNYGLMMAHKSQLARWLHKRMAHNYVQASLMNPYTISMSTINRDSGLLAAKRTNDNKRTIEKAFDELVKDKVLFKYTPEEIRGERNKLVDITYILLPHHGFVGHIKAANKRAGQGVAAEKSVTIEHG